MFDFIKWVSSFIPSYSSQDTKEPAAPQVIKKNEAQEPSFIYQPLETNQKATQAIQPNRAKPTLEEPIETFPIHQLNELFESAYSKFTEFTAMFTASDITLVPIADITQEEDTKETTATQSIKKNEPQGPSFIYETPEINQKATQTIQPNRAKSIFEEPIKPSSIHQLNEPSESAQSQSPETPTTPDVPLAPIADLTQEEKSYYTRHNSILLRQMQLFILFQKIADERANTHAEYEKILQSIKTRKILQSTDEHIELSELEKQKIALSKTATNLAWAVPTLTFLMGTITLSPTVIFGGLLTMGIMSLQQTGVMDKHIASFVKALESAGMSKETAEAFVPLSFTVIAAAINLGWGIRAIALGGINHQIGQIIIQAGNVGMMVATIAQGTAQIASAKYAYDVEIKKSKLTSLEGEYADIDFHIEQIVNALKEISATSTQVSKIGSQQIKQEFSMLAGTYGNIV